MKKTMFVNKFVKKNGAKIGNSLHSEMISKICGPGVENYLFNELYHVIDDTLYCYSVEIDDLLNTNRSRKCII